MTCTDTRGKGKTTQKHAKKRKDVRGKKSWQMVAAEGGAHVAGGKTWFCRRVGNRCCVAGEEARVGCTDVTGEKAQHKLDSQNTSSKRRVRYKRKNGSVTRSQTTVRSLHSLGANIVAS